jgi:tripartite-type tricarboxylate transporter receptor subunit TctC
VDCGHKLSLIHLYKVAQAALFQNVTGTRFVYASNWFALFAPAGTPKNVIAVMSALADPAIRLKFTDLGHEIFPHEQQTPDALRAFQKAEVEKWWPIIKAAGIKSE